MKLLIADDEIDVREGIRYLIDWEKLDFEICGEGKDGKQTLEQILKLQPDVVLMDIRMPRLSGLEVVKQAKEQGFHGKFIILSGYSDFSYAQEAIRYGVTCYLTKPIDEDELEKAVLEAKEALLSEQNTKKKFVQYRDKARDSILKEILTDTAAWQFLDYHDLVLEASVYQVVMYTNYNQNSFRNAWDFADILRLANKNHNSLDCTGFSGLRYPLTLHRVYRRFRRRRIWHFCFPEIRWWFLLLRHIPAIHGPVLYHSVPERNSTWWSCMVHCYWDLRLKGTAA